MSPPVVEIENSSQDVQITEPCTQNGTENFEPANAVPKNVCARLICKRLFRSGTDGNIKFSPIQIMSTAAAGALPTATNHRTSSCKIYSFRFLCIYKLRIFPSVFLYKTNSYFINITRGSGFYLFTNHVKNRQEIVIDCIEISIVNSCEKSKYCLEIFT